MPVKPQKLEPVKWTLSLQWVAELPEEIRLAVLTLIQNEVRSEKLRPLVSPKKRGRKPKTKPPKKPIGRPRAVNEKHSAALLKLVEGIRAEHRARGKRPSDLAAIKELLREHAAIEGKGREWVNTRVRAFRKYVSVARKADTKPPKK